MVWRPWHSKSRNMHLVLAKTLIFSNTICVSLKFIGFIGFVNTFAMCIFIEKSCRKSVYKTNESVTFVEIWRFFGTPFVGEAFELILAVFLITFCSGRGGGTFPGHQVPTFASPIALGIIPGSINYAFTSTFASAGVRGRGDAKVCLD